MIEIDASDLDLDALEALRHLVVHSSHHLVERAHPDEPVDPYALLASGEGGVAEGGGATSAQLPHGTLDAEKD